MPSEKLLPDLRSFVLTLEDDLRARASSFPEIRAYVDREYAQARQAGRTGESREELQEQLFTQGAVAWVLSSIFVRFLEDNGFLDERDGTAHRWLGGHEPRYVDVAKDTERLYFQENPRDSERDYLIHVFETAKDLPGLDRLFDPKHNPLWQLPISADAARDLLLLLRKADPENGEPVHAFHDEDLNTRFLGDLYQDLSESARKRFALLQTPEFVEEFILDYTLKPAIDAFGYPEVRLIDPACGSGHFLLGAFRRLLALRQRNEPALNERELVQRTLTQVSGVDLNPFAVAIARFRLLVAALGASGVRRLEDAPSFEVFVAVGDSLLHGRRPGSEVRSGELFEPGERAQEAAKGFDHYFATEDRELLRTILNRQYEVVVGNPPYITVQDTRVSGLYRRTYRSCYKQYSLVCPFLERFFDLGRYPNASGSTRAGFFGAIVANSFAKREFGKRLVQEHFPGWDVTHIVDTSNTSIPGHGTPTLILFGRTQSPIDQKLRAVLGVRGEMGDAEQPGKGRVWAAILNQIEQPGSESEFISVSDLDRTRFASHPWSLQGGGASALRLEIESRADRVLSDEVGALGRTTVVGEDEAWIMENSAVARRRRVAELTLPLVVGEAVRDWALADLPVALYPYDGLAGRPLPHDHEIPSQVLWPLRSLLARRRVFGRLMTETGRPWWEHLEHYRDKLQTPHSITFAFVSTHNHFVLDRGGKIFKQSAPVVKLPEGASEEEHLRLLGLLNSSAMSFWMRQVLHAKGGVSTGRKMQSEPWSRRLEFDATKLLSAPLVDRLRSRIVVIARRLDGLAHERKASTPVAIVSDLDKSPLTLRHRLDEGRRRFNRLTSEMVAWQEELDWTVYVAFGLAPQDTLRALEDMPPLASEHRPFALLLARTYSSGGISPYWFETTRVIAVEEIPPGIENSTREWIERRLAIIASNKSIRLIEKPEYKRRWNTQPWEVQEKRALRRWLLDRLEADGLWNGPRLTSAARLADCMRQDRDFLQVGALYRGHEDFELTRLVTELVQEEGVPFLAAQRHKPSGLRKRKVWEQVWDLQRQEDALDARTELPEGHPDHLTQKEAEARKAALEIPVPPKYKSTDFTSSIIWRQRGKLDVPKEQFVLYPGAEREADPTLVLGWAGWDHLQQAQALATYYIEMRNTEGWPQDRLLPLLAGLAELLPWLRQWHNDHDPSLGMGMGRYFASFIEEEARRHLVTIEELQRWRR